MKLIKSYAHTV